MRPVNISEESHCLPGDLGSTPEVDFKHSSCVLIIDGLQLPVDHLPCVVEDDVYTAECLLGFDKRCRDLCMLSNVQFDDETGGRILANEIR